MKLHHHVKHHMLGLVTKHPIVTAGVALVGGIAVMTKLATPKTAAVPQNPAPVK